VTEAAQLADFDVLCLQEVADNYPHPRLAGSAGEDQFALLSSLLPRYVGIPGIAVDHPGENGRRRRFGNMIFSRLPVQQVFHYLLPYPADGEFLGMPRMALEAVLTTPAGDVRVVTTHLEYYSVIKRTAQVDALRDIYAQGYRYSRGLRVEGTDGGPFHTYPRPAATIITGDFNMDPADPGHARMLAPFADGTPGLVDAWEHAQPGVPHAPTMCLYQKIDPTAPAYCCDFIFVSDDLKARIRDVAVDPNLQASDHQPAVLTLG
jgi:endonuclease/exonuclease/phosphatase family metal-dependent hydrolase